MRDLRTRTHVFDSDFCIENVNNNQLMIRVRNTTMREVESVFHNASETSEMSFRGRPLHDYTRCLTIRDEGAQIFVMLSGG